MRTEAAGIDRWRGLLALLVASVLSSCVGSREPSARVCHL